MPTLQSLARNCSSTHLLDDEVELGLNWLAYQGARPTLASQSTLFQLTVSQSSCTKPLVSPELAFHAHQNTLVMALCSPSAPLPVTHSFCHFSTRSLAWLTAHQLWHCCEYLQASRQHCRKKASKQRQVMLYVWHSYIRASYAQPVLLPKTRQQSSQP